MKKVADATIVLIAIVLHIAALVALWYFLQPFSTWYLNQIPALGIDLYNSVTHVALHQKHFSIWFSGFKDIWFSGYPLIGDFPQFHYYAMVPFANYFGALRGVQIYVVFSLALLVISCYLLFYKISKNIGLAFLLSILVMLSVNIYGAAVWGGSIPYFANQFFLPLVLFFLVHYFETSSTRWLWATALFAGLSFLGHPLPTLGFVFPSSIMLLLFYPQKGTSWSILKRLKYMFFFFTGIIFVAFTSFYDFIYSTIFDFMGRLRYLASFTGAIGAVSERSPLTTTPTDVAIAAFYKNQIQNLVSGTENSLFVLLILGFIIFSFTLVALLLRKEKLVFLQALPLFLIVLYVVGHIVYNLTGHSFFPQGLYRAFWAFPIVVGALVASLWRPLFDLQLGRIGGAVVGSGAAIVFAVIAYFVWNTNYLQLIDRVHATSDTSSAFPEVLSLKTGRQEQEQLKAQLIPSFLDPKDKNKRLYTSDATVNIWWNSFYDMPLARGYVDPPIGTDRRGSFFLLDIAIGNDVLVNDFKFSPELAKNYALFLIDWFGVHFFEGGHVSPAANVGPSSYLSDIFEKKEEVTTYGAIHRFETASGRPEARFDLPQTLIYYKIKEEHTSPVVYGSNAPVILVISDDPGFEHIWRGLAAQNINSRYVMPIMGGKFIDDLKKEDFKIADAVILHNYSSKNEKKAHALLSDFVKGGGKLFVDTGSEVKDATSQDLADFFPIRRSQRKELGREWSLEVSDNPITEGVNFSDFGSPLFNDAAWKFSYPVDERDLRENATVILKNHGEPVLVEMPYGAGKVIWSGINFPYHFVQYTNSEESELFKNIIAQLVPLEEKRIVPLQARWEQPERVVVNGETRVRGILFKEQNYSGWSVKGRSADKIYKTGPTFPGFMYVPLKNEIPNVIFSFNGMMRSWIVSLVSLLSILIILEVMIFNGKFFGNKIAHIFEKGRKKVASWWEKEEE